jgi:hypothetical protein
MSSYRANSAGNQPYSANLCQQFLKTPGPGHYITPGTHVSTWFMPSNLFPGGKPSSIVIPKTGALSRVSNIPLQSYCHAIVTNNDLWIAAVGWGVVIFLVGIVFFWQAEAKYGRG